MYFIGVLKNLNKDDRNRVTSFNIYLTYKEINVIYYENIVISDIT